MKKQTVEKKAAFFDIVTNSTEEVESIIKSPSKLESICEEDKETREAAPSTQTKLSVNTMSVQEITVVRNSNQERDFDKNPTELYLALSRKDWNAAVARCKLHAEESRIWIYRYESDGKTLRWKLLPIHAAIIFCAPAETVDALLQANPDSIVAQDDQGMLPLHLAIRMGSSEMIVSMLATAATVDAKDRKGRTPRNLAERQEPDKKEIYLRMMSEQATTVAASISSHLRASLSPTAGYSPPSSPHAPASPLPTITMEKVKEAHAREVEKLKREPAAKTIQLTAKLNVLENELKKMPLLEAAIVDLETKLKKHQQVESDLQEKLDETQTTKKQEITKEKNSMDEANKAVISNLVSQVGDLQNKLTVATATKDEIAAEKLHTEETSKNDRSKFIKEISELQIKLGDTAATLDETSKALEKAEALNDSHKKSIDDLNTEIAAPRHNLETPKPNWKK